MRPARRPGPLSLARDSRRRAPDDGFSLVELSVTLIITGIIFGLTFGLIIGLQQQQLNIRATVAGSQQSQLASQEVVQYLRAGASPPAGTTESTTSVTLPAYVGTAVGAQNPQSATVQVTYAAGKAGSLVGTGTLDVTFTGQPVSGPVIVRKIATYFVLAPNAATPIFTYYEYAPTGAPGTLLKMASVPITQTCALQKIVAVGVNVSFFAGPQATPTRGYAGDIATTLHTTVFLRNTSLIFGSTTTTSTSTTLPAGGCQD